MFAYLYLINVLRLIEIFLYLVLCDEILMLLYFYYNRISDIFHLSFLQIVFFFLNLFSSEEYKNLDLSDAKFFLLLFSYMLFVMFLERFLKDFQFVSKLNSNYRVNLLRFLYRIFSFCIFFNLNTLTN